MLVEKHFRKIFFVIALFLVASFFVISNAEAAGLTVGNNTQILALPHENLYYGVTSAANDKGNFLLFEKGYGNTVFKIDYNGNITTNGNLLGSNSYWSLSGNNLFASSTYNLGIGTNNPGSYKLNVLGNTYLNGTVTTSGDLTVNGGDISLNNNAGGLNFNDASAYWLKTATNWGLYWDTTLNQFKFNGSGTTRASIDLDDGSAFFNGSVGIGSASPTAALDVFGKAKTTSGGTIYNTDSSRWLDLPGSLIDSLKVSGDLYSTAGELKTDGTGINYMMGSLGIGTAAPGTYKLYVNGPSYFNDTVFLRNGYNKTLKNYLKTDDGESLINIDDNMTTAEVAEALGRGTNTAGITKVDDSTAPAPGAFEVSSPQNIGPDSATPYWKVDQDSEYIFETWIKVVSSTVTPQRFYAGWEMYNSSKTTFGNVQRYWGSSGTEYDSDSYNDGNWHHIVARISGVGGSLGQFISGTEYARLVLLFNYNSGDTVTRYAGMKLYKSKKIFSSIYAKNGGVSSVDSDGKLVMDYNGNVSPNNLYVSGAGPHYFSNGSVGIGTTTPADKLHVVGNATISGLAGCTGTGAVIKTDASGRLVCGTTTGGVTGSGSTNYVAKWTATSTLGYGTLYDNGTNVGVGTTAPNAKLEIYNNVNYYSTSILATNNSSIAFRIKSRGSNNVTLGVGAIGAPDKIGFQSFDSSLNSANDILLNPFGGYVGIGTTSPAAMLDVQGTLKSSAGKFSVDASGNFTGESFLDLTNPLYKLDPSNSGESLKIAGTVGSLGTGNNYFMGNMGIGITDPSAKLHVLGQNVNFFSGTSANTLLMGRSATESLSITTDDSNVIFESVQDENTPGYGNMIFRVDNDLTADGYFAFQNKTGTNFMRITGSGNVGIGTTDPGTYKLNVNGSVFINGSITLPEGANFVMSSTSSQLTVNKLTVNTIDPLYNIKGTNYSTFAYSVVGGVKEEVIGKIKVNNKTGNEFNAIIDFSKQEVGSDLWVWHQVVDFNKDNVEAVVTPYGSFANVYYSISGDKFIFHSDRPVEVSYRLLAKRFDWREWPTKAKNQKEKAGFILK